MTYTANHRVDTTVKSFRIIERLVATGGTGVSELSRDLGMSKSIVHNHLSTLRELGYVEKQGDEYHASPRFLALGDRVRSKSSVFQTIEQHADVLTTRFDTAVYLLEEHGSAGVVTAVYNGSSESILGERIELSQSALGGALAAELPEKKPAEDSWSDETPSEVFVGPLAPERDTTVAATGLTQSGTAGALGVRIPHQVDGDTTEAVYEAIASLPKSLTSSSSSTERSFVTTKHAWFTE